MKKFSFLINIVFLLVLISACNKKDKKEEEPKNAEELQSLLDNYAEVALNPDLSKLEPWEHEIMPILIECADIMDDIFWKQAYGDKQELLKNIDKELEKKYALINYGPWDRLNNNQAFIAGFEEKSKGANFYPDDMTSEEFDKLENESKFNKYSLIQRNNDGSLFSVPYYEAFGKELTRAAQLLKKAAEIAKNESMKTYLNLRAEALLCDNYYESDLAWLDMKDNNIDIVIGPMDNYEDDLYGLRRAHQAMIIIKVKEESKDIVKYLDFLPEIQKGIPVPGLYKKEKPRTYNEIFVYDALYYAGQYNAGGKFIALNLPDDLDVFAEKGTRKMYIKNIMQAKFEKILMPVAELLIDDEQLKHITFDAFFVNVMCREMGYELGIQNLVSDPKITVWDALGDKYFLMEETKADIMSLHIARKLHEKGVLSEVSLEDLYVSFLASIFRTVRFGTSSPHAKANMLCFNFFNKNNVLIYNEENGKYSIKTDKMMEVIDKMLAKIIIIQGDGNYDEAKTWIDNDANIKALLKKDLEKLNKAKIPVDLIFDQGIKESGI
jgi:hypothetical protein